MQNPKEANIEKIADCYDYFAVYCSCCRVKTWPTSGTLPRQRFAPFSRRQRVALQRSQTPRALDAHAQGAL